MLAYYEKQQSGGDCAVSPCYHVMGSLVKGDTYYARVYAYNSFGYSTRAAIPQPSHESPKTAPKPPKTVIISTTSETTIDVQFPASPDDGGANITKISVPLPEK